MERQYEHRAHYVISFSLLIGVLSTHFKRISIQEAFEWGSQLVDVISPLLPADVLSFLTNVALPCIPQSRDRFIWLPDNHGEFSTKSACVAIRGNPQSVTHLL